MNRIFEFDVGGQQKILHLGRKRAAFHDLEQRIAQRLGKFFFVVFAHGRAQAELQTGHLGDLERGIL